MNVKLLSYITAAAHLGVDLVQTTDADYERQLALWFHVEATFLSSLTLQPDGVLLLRYATLPTLEAGYQISRMPPTFTCQMHAAAE